MIKLICLEMKRNNIRTYIVASVISSAVLLAFLYFVAYVAQVESGEQTIPFRNYANIFRFTGTVSLIIFSIMSAVMYSRFIIGEYTGKNAALLFSYPISRRKILLAKLLLVFAFTSVFMLICTAVPYIIFSMTESVSPIVVQDTMSSKLIIYALEVLGITTLAVGGTGILAMRIGFIKKSVPATIITAFIVSATYGNAAISVKDTLSSLTIGGIGIVVTAAVMFELTKKVDKMEVE